ncbi:AAA family ATPase, partial [Candidatus Peregrinibacteria bacterium]|nr:AAA family ATPase [Candidatus Peregrinibacteria bacterium]
MATKNPDALGPTRSLKPVGDQPPEEVTNTDPGDDEEVTQILTATAARNADEPTTPNRINPLAFHLSIARENRTSLLRKLSLKSSIEPNIVAQARHASYMLIDKETAGNPANNETLSKEIAVIINSRDFITTQDDEGNIIIFALSERGGVERLFDIDESLRKANKQSKILIGECTLLQNDEGLSLLDGSLDRDTLETLHEGETAVSQSLNEKITSDQSRVGKNIKLHTSPHSNPKLVKLLDTVHLVSQELGGPDRLIGYQEELATLLNAATDDDTHIISLEGHAGHGKSRVRTEMLRLLPNSILCSINPDNKNSLGSGLVTIAEQLAEIIKQETSEIQLIPTAYEEMIGLDESDNPVYEEKAISFEQFNALTAGERIIFTTLHPETVSELCYDAMEQLRAAQNPQTLFVLEDLHHADRLSEEYLVKLIKRYADSKDGKAMVTSRPEEMYQSLAFKNLKEEEQTKNSLKVIELKGLSLLTNDTLGRNFAFYSLPPEIRKDGQGQDRKIDTWYRKLAHKAGPSPLYMKSFMDAVIPNLGIEDGTIVIKNPQVLERIDQIDPKSPTDHAVYFQERLANLDDQSRTFLQYVALMSEELGLLQIMAISKEIMGLNREGTLNLSGNLRKGGYTTDDFLRGTICKLQHESTKGIVLDSIDPKEKAVMAKKLYDQFKEDDYVSQKIKYELATIIAGNMNTKPPPDFTENFENKEFWEEYKKLVDSLFQDTTSRQDVEATRLAAQTILQIPRIKDAVATLQENAINNHHPETIRIAIDCLFNLAESSRIEGKYEETAKALDLLKNIRNQHSHLVNNLKILTIGFDSARMQNKVQEMKNLYQEMLN